MSFASFDTPFNDSEKERIREAIDIVDLIEHHYAIPLHRAGRKFKGHCPWHDDKDPSLQVDPDRQTFICYPCQIGGDVFSFVMTYEKVDFKEAMQILAERAGIELHKRPSKRILIRTDFQTPLHTAPSNEDATLRTATKPTTLDPNALLDEIGQEDEEFDEISQIAPSAQNKPSQQVKAVTKSVTKETLLQAADWLARQYHQALLTLEEAKPARQYLEERGILAASVEQFQLGFAPKERDWLTNKVKQQPERIGILESIGNLRESAGQPQSGHHNASASRFYDPFGGRLVFPIRDTKGKTVGFSGRTVPGIELKNPAKYYNTSGDSPLFVKSRLVYALDLARKAMPKSRRVLIMEGYTDVIMSHQYGFCDAVAVMGVALGAEHIRELKRYADQMILILDGDVAGMRNAERVLALFVAQGVEMKIVTLPDGADPCDFLQRHGAAALETLLQTNAVDALEHMLLSATKGLDVQKDVAGSVKALDSVLEILAQAPMEKALPNDPMRLRVEKTVQNLAHRFLMPIDEVKRRLREIRETVERRQRDEKQRASQRQADNHETTAFFHEPQSTEFASGQWPDRLERELLEFWLSDPTAIYEFWGAIPVERCRSPITRMVYEKCNEIIERNLPATFERVLTAFDENPQMGFYLVELQKSGMEKRRIFAQREENEPFFAANDEVGELEESLRCETEEQLPWPAERRAQLVREIIDGFDRRDEPRQRIDDLNQLRNDSLTDEEKWEKLIQLQTELRRQQEEKRKNRSE